jgi:hypothetical protein
MKVTDLNLQIGEKIKLYVQRYKDGSGSSMGAGVEGKPEYLTEVVWAGPVYSGVMGQADYLDGAHVGMFISAKDILAANPNLKA